MSDGMTRGLLWLPLLIMFFGLAWAGWNEYRKLEGYKVWATQFERAKYDIYAALGQQGDVLTWGVPTRRGIIKAETLNLSEATELRMEVNNQPANPEQLPEKGKFSLGFTLPNEKTTSIPFTDKDIAKQWFDFVKKNWNI